METISINKKQRLYVITSADGRSVSALGFDVLERRAGALARELGAPSGGAAAGTLERYTEYMALLELARLRHEKSGWRSASGLSPQLCGLEGRRVEVVTTYGETRRFNVGESTGWLPCHLEISRRNCYGGPAAEFEYNSVRVIR